MAKILAKNYQFRADLENEVRSKYGLTVDRKDHTIEGTRAELARLQLSDRSLFYGISCIITDDPTKPRKEGKADRGEQKEFGLGAMRSKPIKRGSSKK